MCVGPHRDAECSGQAKIGQFDTSLAINEQILERKHSVEIVYIN